MNSIMKFRICILAILLGIGASSTQFLRCTEFVRMSAHKSIREADKLKAYGLFKQGTSGDCNPAIPPSSDIYERSKRNAWCAEFGKSREAAQIEYVALIDRLSPEWRYAIAN
jgi:diazepam-binding inhibitor (GABA receptor modulating acyl-CoA-binding protein)